MSRRRSLVFAMLSGIAPVVFAGPVLAQTAPQETPPPSAQTPPVADSAPVPPADAVTKDVIVTGSRIVRDGYQAPTPTTVVSAQDLAARAPVNVADYVNELPQMMGSVTPRTTLQSSVTNSGSANVLNMRGLGTVRTLVLLDGRRVVSATLNSAVDINLLPSNLVKRVDVVTGGASAAYGSDAVAGVTNFILDEDFSGLKGSVQYGITDMGDAPNWSGNLAFGHSFAGGKGHILLSASGLVQQGVDSVLSRSWYRPGYGLISNPAWTATNGQPAKLVRDDVGFTNATLGGMITSGPLKGTTFLGDGQTGTFTYGDIISGTSQAGGTLEDPNYIWGLLSKLRYYTTFAHISYDITDHIRAYAEYGGGYSISYNWSAPTTRFGNITIHNDNYYLKDYPNVLANAFGGGTTFSMGRLNYDLHTPGGHQTDLSYSRRQNRFLAGIDATFLKTGKISAYYQYGESDLRYTYNNMLIPAYYDLATDAIANPAVGGVAGVPVGAPICRSTLTNPTNGCVPVNIFGPTSPSQQAIAYMTGVTQGFAPGYQNVHMTQSDWSINGQIEPFSTWAGPVSLATGFEYRREGFKAVVDQASLQHLWFGGGFTPASGAYNVKEFFGEAIVPLLRNAPLVKSLDLNAAVRRTDYSYSGTVNTWKAGLSWDVYSDLRLRGTLSRDIRAPNLQDLFDGGRPTVGTVLDPLQKSAANPQGVNVSVTTLTGGNPSLTPEIANTRTFGAVYQPSWLRGFSVSADYYKIAIKDAIVPLSSQQIVDECYGVNGLTPSPAACALITQANPNNLIDANIHTGNVNASRQQIEGIDYELSYRTPINAWGDRLSGDLTFHLVASQRISSWTILNNQLTNSLGTPTDGPRWRGLLSIDYAQGPSRTTATIRYFGSGVLNNWPASNTNSVSPADNHYDSVAYLDLAENYDVTIRGAKVTLFAVMENAFDTAPPAVAGGSFGTNSMYDLIGRSFRIGVRFKL
jgi:iron complex outermembrane recepter protein